MDSDGKIAQFKYLQCRTLVKMKCQELFTQKIDFFLFLNNMKSFLHITEIISALQIGKQSQKTEIICLRQ